MTPIKKYSPEWWSSLSPDKVGGETEKIVEKLFKEWNLQQSFVWARLPDAKAARGRIAAQIADYIYRNGKYAGAIEVKALKHLFRLPSERVSQLPVLHKWSLAGSCDAILVFHYLRGTWRIMKSTELETGVPSWDLRCFDEYPSAESALKSTGWFG